jgi:hypothetical protein
VSDSKVSTSADAKKEVKKDLKKEKRAARFSGDAGLSTPEMEEKKKARAARFGGAT